MSESFVEFLTREKVDPDTIHQAGRYYLAEKTDDLAPDEMRERAIETTGQSGLIATAIECFEQDREVVEYALLAMFQIAWDDPAEEQRIRRCFAEARQKLPVIETAIIAIAAMYAIYLITTGGKEMERIDRRKDGTYVKTTKWVPPMGPLRAIVDLFKLSGK